MKKAIIPGSYDPITLGHLDIIKRSSQLFDEIIIVVTNNTSKNMMFSPEQRKKFAELATQKLNNIKVVVITDELIVRFATRENVKYIIRGLRMNSDFEYELQLSQIYKSLDEKIETILIPTNPNLSYYSSSIVRELIKYNEDTSNYVPKEIVVYLQSIGKGMNLC